MEITIQYFGVIADITKKREEQFHFDEATITLTGLKVVLEQRYPEIGKAVCSLAVNQKIAAEDRDIQAGDEIALLPPFSGG